MEIKPTSLFSNKNFTKLWVLPRLTGFGLLFLVGCDNMPHVFSGSEVPQGTLNEERLVPKPNLRDIAGPNWPRLGDVPEKPQDFSSENDINKGITDMRTDRDQAQTMKRNVDSPVDPQPATQE